MKDRVSWPSKIAKLSFERKLYALILIVCGIVSTWTIYHESKDESRNRQLAKGWNFTGKKRDIADFEWTFWFSNIRESIILCLIGHVVVSCFFRSYLPWAKNTAVAIFCVYCVQAAVGEAFILISISYCIVFHAIITIFNSSWICWFLTISNLLLLHFDAFYMDLIPSLVEAEGNYLGLVYSAFGFTILRCSSFSMERINDKDLHQHGIFHLLRYNLYLPYFFFGPVMTYDIFVRKNEKPSSMRPAKSSILDLIKASAKICFSVLTVDLILHFIHVSSIAVDIEFLRTSSCYVVGFVLFSNVLLDWMKAAVLYRITLGIAKATDGYDNAPRGPKCTATICTFADTYFDRGIQHWVSRYIYDAIGGKHSNLSKETYASVLAFLMVGIWQGLGIQVTAFVVLNCLGLTIEFFISQMTPEEDKRYKRIVAFFLGLNYWCILIFNIVGIKGTEAAFVSFQTLFFGGNITNMLTTAFLGYCYAGLLTLGSNKKMKQQ